MGLFLQKTNIIRDYLEDLDQGRTWWPDEIWAQYANSGAKPTGTLDHFKRNPNAPESIACLNHMVTDALELVPVRSAPLSWPRLDAGLQLTVLWGWWVCG
jgi:farnesyl-diphosphate farnesyltransferase